MSKCWNVVVNIKGHEVNHTYSDLKQALFHAMGCAKMGHGVRMLYTEPHNVKRIISE